jgi:hypothetical protein
MRKILLPLALCSLACAAQAADSHDDAPLYEGVWNVRFTGQRAARFELRDWSGFWRETGSTTALPSACRGKKFPVTVQVSTPEEFEFTVWGSSVNAACPDTSFAFKPIDPKRLEASVDAGGKATMTRLRP